MHLLSNKFADQLAKRVKETEKEKEFGELLMFKSICLARMDDGERVTLEHFIKGQFVKYITNNGKLVVQDNDILGFKAVFCSLFLC